MGMVTGTSTACTVGMGMVTGAVSGNGYSDGIACNTFQF